MPIPTPDKNESESSFMSRCVRFVMDEGTPNEQAVAICSSQYRQEKTKTMTWKTIDRKRASYLPYARTQFHRALKAQAKEFIDQVKENGMSGDYDISVAPIDRAMRNVYDKVMTNFITDTYNQFVETAQKTDINHAVAVSRWFDENVPDLSALMTGTSRRSLKDILKIAVFQGYSMSQFVSEVTSSYAISEKRAELIGRTEIIRASNAGSIEGAKLTNLPMKKFWLSTRDNRTRGADIKDLFDHYNVDENKGYLLDDLFTVSGERLEYPCDRGNGASAGNTINCRCTITYEVIEEGEETFLEETVEPTTFDFSGKKRREREWHEEYGWDVDKQLGRIAVKTEPLHSVLGSGTQAYYKGITRRYTAYASEHQKKINMNGYKLGEDRAKRTWHHEYGHAIDFQFSNLPRIDDVYDNIGPNRFNLSKNDFAFSNLALRDIADDYENIFLNASKYQKLKQGLPKNIPEADTFYGKIATDALNKRELRKLIDDKFDNGVITFDEVLQMNGLRAEEINDFFDSVYDAFLQNNILPTREITELLFKLDDLNISLKSRYTAGLGRIHQIINPFGSINKNLFRKYGADLEDRISYYKGHESSNFFDFFGSLTNNKHGVKGHENSYYRKWARRYSQEVADTVLNESHAFEAFANHVALRASNLAPINLKIMNHIAPNAQNKFFRILDVIDESDMKAVLRAYNDGNYTMAGELLGEIIDSIEGVKANYYLSNPYTQTIMDAIPKAQSLPNPQVSSSLVSYKIQKDFLDRVAEVLLYSPESYWIVEGFKSTLTLERYRRLIKYLDSAIQNVEPLDESKIDNILFEIPQVGEIF